MSKMTPERKRQNVFAEVRPDASGFAGAFPLPRGTLYRRTTKTGAMYLECALSAPPQAPALIPIDVFRCAAPDEWHSFAWGDGSPTQPVPLQDCEPVGGRIDSLALSVLGQLGQPIDVREGLLCTSDIRNNAAMILAPEKADWRLGDGYQIPINALSTAVLGATQYQVTPHEYERDLQANKTMIAKPGVITIEADALRCVTQAGEVSEDATRENAQGLLAAPGASEKKNAKGALKEIEALVRRAGGKWTRVARGDDLMSVEYMGPRETPIMYDASTLAKSFALHARAEIMVTLLGEWIRTVSDFGEGYTLVTMIGPV